MFIKLPEPFKTQWLGALRDPDARQTKSVLSRRYSTANSPPVGMCCLGVAADILDPDGWQAKASIDYWRNEEATLTGALSDNKLEEQIYKVLTQAFDSRQTVEEHLMGMNDAGQTFPEIANWIEENL